ncbi:MAG: hypothetical protein C0504_19740 [Candidatus Solibacter sp.]|nr:hypothetical protein [Candidatus Solibacter sp.]
MRVLSTNPMKRVLSSVLLVMTAMCAGAQEAGRPEAVGVAIETDGSARAEALKKTLEAALAGLRVELTPEAGQASWVIRLRHEKGAALEIGASAGEGVEFVRGLAEELERVSPALRAVARAAACRACRGGNQVALGLGDGFDDPAEELLAANAIRESLKKVTGQGERTASAPASIITPAAGATLLAPNATFAWNVGTGVSRFWLFVGNWLGGDTLYSADQGTNLTATVPGLPTDGRKIYVRLWSLIDGTWESRDFEFRAYSASGDGPRKAQITSPAAGATLTGTSATVNWSPGVAVTRYWLFAGLWEGGNTLYSADQGTALSATVTGLPASGQMVYFRLWSYIDGAWQSTDATYQASGAAGAPAKAGMTSPAAGSALTGSTAVFNWNAGSGVTRYYLMAGLWKGGNTLFNQDMNTAQSATVTGLPVDGSRIHVRLFSYIGNAWQFSDHEYTAFEQTPGAAQKAVLMSPAAGAKLGGSAAAFVWSAGKKAEGYFLFIGDWQGGNSRYSQYFEAGTVSANVTGLPVDGRMLFVRLWSHINGQWEYNDYQVRAAGQ